MNRIKFTKCCLMLPTKLINLVQNELMFFLISDDNRPHNIHCCLQIPKP